MYFASVNWILLHKFSEVIRFKIKIFFVVWMYRKPFRNICPTPMETKLTVPDHSMMIAFMTETRGYFFWCKPHTSFFQKWSGVFTHPHILGVQVSTNLFVILSGVI